MRCAARSAAAVSGHETPRNATHRKTPESARLRAMRRTCFTPGEWRRGPDAAVARELAATDRVDRHACRVRTVLDGQPRLEFDFRAAESLAFDAQKTDFVVLLPWHVVARADVDVVAVHALREVRLHGFG